MLRGLDVWITVSVASALISGLIVWILGASNSRHVGASGIIFAYFGYILSVAFFERHWKSVLIAVVVGFFYGGMLFGALPGADQTISWQGHLGGLISGVLIGYFHMVVFGGAERSNPYEYAPVNTKETIDA